MAPFIYPEKGNHKGLPLPYPINAINLEKQNAISLTEKIGEPELLVGSGKIEGEIGVRVKLILTNPFLVPKFYLGMPVSKLRKERRIVGWIEALAAFTFSF